MSDVGDRICAYRKKVGWTQVQLAKHAGVSRETITRIENGRTPDYETLERIATAFGIPRQTLIPGGVTDSAEEVAALVQAEGFTSLNVISKLRHLADATPFDDVRSEARIGLFVGALAGGDCHQLCSIVTDNQLHSYDFGANAPGIVKIQQSILHFLRGTHDYAVVAEQLRDAVDHRNPTMDHLTHDLWVLRAGFLTWAETLCGNSEGAEQALRMLETSAQSDLDVAHLAEIYVSTLTELERWSEAECVARFALRTASGPMYSQTLRASLGDARAHLGIRDHNFDKVREGVRVRVESICALVELQVGISLPQVLIDLACTVCLAAAQFEGQELPELQELVVPLTAAGIFTATQQPLASLDIITQLLHGAERLIASTGQAVYVPELYRVTGQRLLLIGQRQEARTWFLKARSEAKRRGNRVLEDRAQRSFDEAGRLPRTFTFPSATWHSPFFRQG